MIFRRRRLWFVVLVGVALAGGAWIWAFGAALSTKDAELIKDGMTREIVRHIMRRPPDSDHFLIMSNLDIPIVFTDTWNVADGSITVFFDVNNRVTNSRVECEGFIQCQVKRLFAKIGY